MTLLLLSNQITQYFRNMQLLISSYRNDFCLTRLNHYINILCILIAFVNAVEVHFETPDSGFFLKHSPRQPGPSGVGSDVTKTVHDASALLSVDRFTIVQTQQPVSIRASYGPFSTKQTVPAKFIVPDALEAQAADNMQVSWKLLMFYRATILIFYFSFVYRTLVRR